MVLTQPIYFRADASSQIGLGHLIRSLALAQMLRPDFQAHFLMRQPAAAVADQVHRAGFPLSVLPDTVDYLTEARILGKDLLQNGDLLVLDGYNFTTKYQQALRQKEVSLIFLDDLQAFPFATEAIINQAGGVNPANYQLLLPHTRLCLGPDYALLREPFVKAARKERQYNPEAPLFLNMGGADPKNDTCLILEKLLQVFPDVAAEVVIGSAYLFQEELEHLVDAHPKLRIHQNLDAQAMCRLMQSCSAAILPPSSVAYEWCSVGGPLFLYQTANNQAGIKSFLLRQGLAQEWPAFKEFIQSSQKETAAGLMLARQRQVFQGQSPEKLRRLFQQLSYRHRLQLLPAGQEDMAQLYEWINDPAVRANSFNPEPIALEVHRIWYQHKLKDPNTLILMAQLDGMAAGMIRYDQTGDQVVISYLLAPACRGLGLGSVLLEKGAALAAARFPGASLLVGHVRKSNRASMVSFEKNGYRLSTTIVPADPDSVVFEKPLK